MGNKSPCYIVLENNTQHTLTVQNVWYADVVGEGILEGLQIQPFSTVKKPFKSWFLRMKLVSSCGGLDVFELRQTTSFSLEHYVQNHHIAAYPLDDETVCVEIAEAAKTSSRRKRSTEEHLLIPKLHRNKFLKGRKYLNMGLYLEAWVFFEDIQAYLLNSNEVINRYFKRSKGAYEALELFEKGEKLMEEKNFTSALSQFEQARKKTTEEIMLERISDKVEALYKSQEKSILHEVEEYLEKKLYEDAKKHIDEKLKTVKNATSIDNLKAKKADILYIQAEDFFQQGFDDERANNEEALETVFENFEAARSHLQQAQEVSPSPKTENKLKIVELKLEGSKLFKEALAIEIEALEMFLLATTIENWRKHQQALLKYEEVEKMFKEAARDDRLKKDLQFVQQVIKKSRDGSANMLKIALEDVLNLEMVDDWVDAYEKKEEIDEDKIIYGDTLIY